MNDERLMMKVGVIFGGRSDEHEVSLRSARSVMGALDGARYEIVPIGIDKNGRWLTGDAVVQRMWAGEAGQPAIPFAVLTDLDIVFPVLHGPYGEDGTIQGLLETINLPYVGSGVVGSAVGMDKAIFKDVMTARRLPIVAWELVLRADWGMDEGAILDKIEAALPYPLFVKPANLGSSVGISKCKTRDALRLGIVDALRYDRRVVVEQGLDMRELEIAVLGNENPVCTVVGEIHPGNEFYDYEAKYLAEPGSEAESALSIPADLPTAVAEEAQAIALQAYKAIDCAGLARVDMMLDREDGRLYINEINTLPGFTSISMYPKLWAATGLPYPKLLDKLIALAMGDE